MAMTQTPDEELRAALRAVRDYGSQAKASLALGLSRQGLQGRLLAAKARRVELEPEQILPPDYQGPDPEQRPTVRVRVKNDDQGKYRVVAIGDAHDSPRIADKSRFYHLGCYAREQLADCPAGTEPLIVQIGDMLSLDSLCRYEPNDTLRGKSKPNFLEDIASCEAALAEFDHGADGCAAPKHVTLGNHEDRIWSFTDRTPETAGMMRLELDRLLERHGWTYSPYGVPYFVGGVAFIHVPLNTLGRPVGGQLAGSNIARDATYDWVYGHDHRGGAFPRPKLGPNNKVTVINLGCALPQGEIEPYAQVAMTGWWWGAWTLEISGGRIQGYSNATMQQLEERYG